MKRKEYTYKNLTFILTPTFDEASGLKLVNVLPCCSLYVVGISYGVSLSGKALL